MNTNHSIRIKQKGYTIMEFMVASALGLLVLTAVGSVFSHTRALDETAQNRIIEQEERRITTDLISRDARMAGNFGCFSLGKLFAPDTSLEASAETRVQYSADNKNRPPLLLDRPKAPLNDNILVHQQSFGVNVSLPANLGFPQNFTATANSNALIFHYGLGTTSVTGLATNGDTLTSITVDSAQDPTQAVLMTTQDKGFLALASCNALNIFRAASTPAATSSTFTNADFNQVVSISNDEGVNRHHPAEIGVYQYMVSVYVVGTPIGGVQGLYRFELGADGNLQGPQLLLTGINQMNIDLIYATAVNGDGQFLGCPDGVRESVGNDVDTFNREANNYQFAKEQVSPSVNPIPYLRSPEVDNITPYLAPAGIEISLSGLNRNGQALIPLNIHSTIRGGNSCATREFHFK